MLLTMPNSIQLAIVQFKPRKGDYEGNLLRLGGLLAQVDALTPRPQIVHLAETALTGYFVEGGVHELARTAGAFAADLARAYRPIAARPGAARSGTEHTLDVVAGFYELWNGTLHNCAMYVTLGGGDPVIRHVHRKMFLPTYGLFDEERFVERGHELRAFDTPFGRAAILVCEDAWHSIMGTLAALDGAQLIFLSAAAPARGLTPRVEGTDDPSVPTSVGRWDRLARDIAEEHGVFVSVAHLVGSEGGKTFPGGSIVVGPKGDLRLRAPLWDEAIATVTLDAADVARARADMPLLSDLRTMMPHLATSMEKIRSAAPVVLEYDPAVASDVASDGTSVGTAERTQPSRDRSTGSGVAPAGATHHGERSGALGAPSAGAHVVNDGAKAVPPLAIDARLAAEWLEHFVRDEVHQRGFTKAVVAVSGGVDSAVTAFLATRALGRENVIGVRLPYRASSPESLEHAHLVTTALGIDEVTIDITAAVDGYLASAPDADPLRRGNVMARVRMTALFDLSARYAALPLGTGNKTERLLGYFTWHADDSPPINPLGDLFKTQVWALATYLGVPDVIVKKPATADLIVGQTDETDLGISYAKADVILHWLVSGFRPEELAARGFTMDEVATVGRRLDATHWKRRLPTVAVLSRTAIGESYLRPVDY
jgi:NAD+ synthetase